MKYRTIKDPAQPPEKYHHKAGAGSRKKRKGVAPCREVCGSLHAREPGGIQEASK